MKNDFDVVEDAGLEEDETKDAARKVRRRATEQTEQTERHIGMQVVEVQRVIDTLEYRIRIKDKTIDAADLVNAGLTKQVTDLRSALDKARADVTRLRKQNASLLATMHERKLESRTRVPKGLERAKKPVSR